MKPPEKRRERWRWTGEGVGTPPLNGGRSWDVLQLATDEIPDTHDEENADGYGEEGFCDSENEFVEP